MILIKKFHKNKIVNQKILKNLIIEIQKKILMFRIYYYFNEALLKLWYYAKIMT